MQLLCFSYTGVEMIFLKTKSPPTPPQEDGAPLLSPEELAATIEEFERELGRLQEQQRAAAEAARRSREAYRRLQSERNRLRARIRRLAAENDALNRRG